MMKYYQEITILETFDLSENYILNKVFLDLHKEFVKFNNSNGFFLPISFPMYDKNIRTLGNKIRIFFETESEYNMLDINNSLRKYNDFVHFSKIRPIPNLYQYGCYSRKQSKSNYNRLARRYAKRKNISFDEALNYYHSVENKYISLPYMNLFSSSSNQNYKLFIEFEIKQQEIFGSFNSFGLSKNGTVPIF